MPPAHEQTKTTFVHGQDPVLTSALKHLGPESYTAHRLQHATSEHLYLTTRRCFIGPIPEGWLKSHRKEWYTHHLQIHRGDKAPSFNACANQGRHRRLTGLDGPSASAAFRASFPQPDNAEEDHADDGGQHEPTGRDNSDTEDYDDDDDDDDVATIRPISTIEEADPHAEATLDTPPALDVPRSAPEGEDETLRRESGPDAEAAVNSYSTAKTIQSPASSTPHARNASYQSQASQATSTQSQQPTLDSTTSYETASEGSGIIIDEPGAPTTPTQLSQAGPVKEQGEDDGEDGGMETPRPRGSPDPDPFSDDRYLATPGNGSDSLTSQSPLIRATTSHPPPSIDVNLANTGGDNGQTDSEAPPQPAVPKHSPGVVHFAEPEILPTNRELQVRARLVQSAHKKITRRFTRGKLRDGEIVKMEKMLVKIDITTGSEQPSEDYDEKDSQRVETRAVEKWREFMVVCRECHDEDAVLCLEMYKTRVIPASNKNKTKKRFAHEIKLSPTNVNVNLYSSLDKTLVLWRPKGPRTSICFLRPRSGASAVEWFTFLRGVLGHERPQTLQVNIPNLDVSVRISNPFARFESAQHVADAADGDEAAMVRTMKEEQAIAGRIIQQCMDLLVQSGDWNHILPEWIKKNRVGLAWRRYDRIEWIHGAHERKMYGSLAMQRTHELELRPKEHYPTLIRPMGAGGDPMPEPAPVEGFLIRLTSQKGNEQKIGKLFYKRLYFTTHDRYLLFSRPAKAAPPPPPKMPMQTESRIPTAKQIADKIPLIFAVNPYPLHDEKISWLDPANDDPASMAAHDQDACDEASRNVKALLNCDGFIDLCDVMKVRKIKHGATPADDNIESGSDVDFDQSVDDSHHDDGTTTEPDSDRTFELVLRNGLVVRLQAFSKATRKEWMKRLRALVTYWSIRITNDLDTFKAVRRQNLATLNIDERAEAYIGQFARKWEVVKSFASPELYNVCGISSCRAIHRSGILFRKPRIHATFTRCHVILCHGHLVIFEDTLRRVTGKKLVHVHHERIACIDLRDCYLYSGLITEPDLLYHNQTFDNNMPGHHALPRLYVEDNWTSSDEDTMTTFVIWHSRRKGWFRSSKDQDDVKENRKRDKRKKQKSAAATSDTEGDDDGKSNGLGSRLKRVSQLGVPGRSVVFKARSRAERDHWVMGISNEIERVVQAEDVRVVGADGDDSW
ncbi:hypothetical protein AAFC00_002341 [Neodothiora populina]|uniref:PH domain-containing protein n=1 Tax=Neodothiora populina TaxID=2781224 RepID=A0ABR3PH41_9PEZI